MTWESPWDGPIAVVTGGRHYREREVVFAELDRLKPSLVIHGGGTGADAFAAEWANARGVFTIVVPVTDGVWKRVGNVSGPMRNELMTRVTRLLASDSADPVPAQALSFPGGAGTRDATRRFRTGGILVWTIPEAP